MNSSTPTETQQSIPEEAAITSAPSFDNTSGSENTIEQAIAAMALNDLRGASMPASLASPASAPPAPAAPAASAHVVKHSHGLDEVEKAVHGIASVVAGIAPVLGPLSVPAEIASAVLKETTSAASQPATQP
jgi:hypothetical protein